MSDREIIADILGRWREDAERGRHVEPEALISSHPELAVDLRRHFEAQDLVDRFFAEADARPVEPPDVLGDYRVGREIGRGGMGVVYEAEQISMGRRVALKVLFPTIATTVSTRKRFEREARITGRLHHTNIVMVHAMGRQDGYLYFAMELVEGKPLDEIITHLAAIERGAPGRTSVEGITARLHGPDRHVRVAEMFAGAADALQVAHAHGVIHRDVKPSNLILDELGVLKLTDFGLARLVGDQLAVTRTGDVLGTPLYMSPEQVRGVATEIDHRTDVYSLGATLYEVLTGRRPHAGDDIGAVCASILTNEAPRVRNVAPSVPRDLATIAEKALAKERGDRYGSAGEMAADLRAFAEGRAIRARPLGPLQRGWRKVKRHRIRTALAATVLVLGVLGAVLAFEADRELQRRRDVEYEVLLRRARLATERLTDPVVPTDGLSTLGATRPRAAEALFTRAIQLRPDRPEAWVGRALLAARDSSDQLADLEAAVARGLSRRTYHLARAFVLRRAQRSEEARQEERQAAPLAVESPHDEVFEGRTLIVQGKRRDGIARLSSVIREGTQGDPILHLAYLHRARAYETEGDWASAVQDYAKLLDAGGQDPSIPLRVACLWRRLGQTELAERVFREALALARERFSEAEWLSMWVTVRSRSTPDWVDTIVAAAVAENPDSLLIRAWQACHLARRGDAERARGLMDEVLERLPAEGPVRVDLLESHGEMLAHLRAWKQAEAAFRRVLVESPRHRHAGGNLGLALCEQGRRQEAEALLRAALERDPFDPLTLQNLGSLILHRGAVDEARALAHDGLRLAPRQSGLHALLARCAFDERDFAGALTAIDKALELAPDEPRYLATRAAALNNLGRYEEALHDIEAALRSAGGDPHRFYVRSCALEKLGRFDEALAALEEAPEETRTGRIFHATHARLLRETGQTERAREALDASLEQEPKTAWDWRERAWELLAQGRHELAIHDFVAAVKLEPRSAHAQRDLADALLRAGRPADALKALDAAEKLGLPPERTSSLRGTALANVGRYAEALPHVEAQARLLPDTSEVQFNLGVVLWKLDRHKEGLAVFERAYELAPQDPKTVGSLAEALWQLGDPARGLAILDGLPAATLRDDRLRKTRADCLHGLLRFEEALAEYARLTEARRDMVEVQYSIAYASNQVGRYDDAVRAATRALELDDGKGADLYTVRGTANYKSGRFEAAAKDYRRAIDRGTTTATAYDLLMSALSRAGRPADALAVVAEAERRFPGALELRGGRMFALSMLGRTAEAAGMARAILADPGTAAADASGQERFNALMTLAACGGAADALAFLDAWPKPRARGWHLARAEVLSRLRRFEEAVTAYEAHAATGPLTSDLAYNFARALVAVNRHDRAHPLLTMLISRGRDNARTRAYRGVAAHALGRYEEAAEDLARAIEGGDHAADICFLWVDSLERLGRFEEALAAVRRARTWHPQDLSLRSGEGVCLLDLGRLPEARTALSALLEAQEHRDVRLQLAFVLVTMGHVEEGLRHLERAAREADLEPRWLLLRARGLAMLGREDEARAALAGVVRGSEAEVQFGAAAIQVRLGDRKRALELWARHGDVPANRDGAWGVLALRTSGARATAAQAAQVVIQRPFAARDAAYEAYLCAVAKQAERARKLLGRKSVWSSPEQLLFRAQAYAVLGNKERARAEARKAEAAHVALKLALPPLDPALRAARGQETEAK